MPAPALIFVGLLCKFHPNGAENEYFGAKTCKFRHLPALAENPGYLTADRCGIPNLTIHINKVLPQV